MILLTHPTWYYSQVRRMTLDVLHLTLPLNEGYILWHTNLVSEVHGLHHWQRICWHVYNMLINTYLLKFHYTFLDHISNEQILHFYVLQLIMKHRILGKLDATIVVTPNNCSLNYFTEQSHKQLLQPHYFSTGSTSNNILSHYSTLGNRAMLSTYIQRNQGKI